MGELCKLLAFNCTRQEEDGKEARKEGLYEPGYRRSTSGEELCGSLPSPSGKQLIKREGSYESAADDDVWCA